MLFDIMDFYDRLIKYYSLNLHDYLKNIIYLNLY